MTLAKVIKGVVSYNFHKIFQAKLNKNEWNIYNAVEIEQISLLTTKFFYTTYFLLHWCCRSCKAANFMKELVDKMRSKRSENYSQTVSFILQRIRFDILRTCVISLRGERKSRKSRALELKEVDIGLCNLTEHIF